VTVASLTGRVWEEVASAAAARGVPAAAVLPQGKEYGGRETGLAEAAAAAEAASDASGLRALALSATMDLVAASRVREALSRPAAAGAAVRGTGVGGPGGAMRRAVEAASGAVEGFAAARAAASANRHAQSSV